MAVKVTPGQINAMGITERVTSIISLLSIFFILTTFLLGRGFDKPINRLIFFASWSNLGGNIGTLIAEDGIAAGQQSSLCQFQAFAIQMFLGVDALWALCMSVNVYLALFRGWTAQGMRAQEWKYFVGCYGCSFVPAIVYVFVNTRSRGRVYGPALLWCWIQSKWDPLRIATLYGIVWLALAFALVVYILAFIKVWKNRHELSGLFNPFNENPFEGRVTTEIDITTHALSPSSPSTPFRRDEETAVSGFKFDEARTFDPYSVVVEVGPNERPRKPSAPELFRVRTLTRNHALTGTNPDAWLYARVAFLFFCSLLICWVPASINRFYSMVYPDNFVFGLNYIQSLILPLQGFFNALVYAISSQTACRNLWRSMTGGQELPRKNSAVPGVNDSVVSGGNARLDRSSRGIADTKLERLTRGRTSERLDSDSTSLTYLRGNE